MGTFLVLPNIEVMATHCSYLSPQYREVQLQEAFLSWEEEPSFLAAAAWFADGQHPMEKLPALGGMVVELAEDEAAALAQTMGGRALILRNRAIGIIPAEQTLRGSRETLEDGDLWHLEALGLKQARQQGYSFTGAGVRVAVMDTGIDGNHPELRGKVIESYDLTVTPCEPVAAEDTDIHGHGTHVAALIAGDRVGVAPGAALINALTARQSRADLAGLLSALEQVATLTPGVNILNISLGQPTQSLDQATDDFFDAVFQRLTRIGILPIAAIGNSGRDITCSPGNCRSVISVGAVERTGGAALRVWSSSSSGQVLYGRTLHDVPSLVAPGHMIYSASPGQGYIGYSGTSMAAPLVSGVAALILEEYQKNLTFDEAREELLRRCQKLPLEGDRRQGAGLIQVLPFAPAS
ncbi:MAG: S8 family serine peptidase [Oscillatoriales cyanobacterium SM2_2_1]|nr:S8 family serine peptidase [Oscillatoriales cyanobacterium SM2_2_1]